MESTTESLLRSAVVALDIAGSPLGTGFLVAPRIVATCAHVLAGSRAELPKAVTGSMIGRDDEIELVPVPAWFFGPGDGGPDLAFLWASAEPNAPHVVLSATAGTGDPLVTYGHPEGDFRGGQSATFQYAGPSRLGTADARWEPQRVFGVPVSTGYSGSPVLNRRTGAVCGMLCLSNDRGSAHLVGAADILGHLPEEAAEAQAPESVSRDTTWLGTLTDEQIHAGGWPFPGPRLREYLRTAVRAALLHSPPASGDDASVGGGLPAVYVDQSATRASPALGTRIEARAGEVFERDEHAFVFGGPGLGKSSLLRMGLAKLAERWLSDHAQPEIPVRVQATDLVDAQPLPRLIAASVEADLSAAGVLTSWPPEFFGSEPLRGVRWLVLVDGLDDIVDAESRRAVMAKLAGVARSGGPYRFVIASRPLPAQEVAQQDAWIAGRYELRPFSAEQLRLFAERLFAALGSAAPRDAADRLAGELGRANLADIARVPLIATMLCRLLAADRHLPAGLVELYEEFVHTLAGPQYVAGSRGIHTQAESAFRPYGHVAVRAVAAVLDRSAELLARLALARHDGAVEPALDLLVGWEAAARPAQIPERRWREFLKGILRRSGLLTERRGDFVFVHETIRDYLAARSVVADRARSFAAFDHLFYQWQRPWPGVGETWRQPGWRYSYTRFLVALWPNPARTAGALRQLAERGGLSGCEFIVSLFEDGVVVDREVTGAAASTLARIASTSVSHGFAARQALALLARIDAHEWLARVMTAERSGEETRDRAAIMLAESGDARGADRLAALAVNRDRDVLDRLDAYAALERLDDERATDLLFVIFRSLVAEMGGRRACEHIPARMGAARGADLLAAIAGSRRIQADLRESAARALERRGDPRGTELLVAGAGEAISKRLSALAALAELRDPRAAGVLRLIAGNGALSGRVRLHGTEILARQNDPHVPNLLTAIVRAPHTEQATRVEAVALLAELGAKENLRALAANREVRAEAVRALIALADEHDTDALAAYAADSRLSPRLRNTAARTLALFGAPATGEAEAGDPRDEAVPAPPPRSPGSQQNIRIELFVALSRWPVRAIGNAGDQVDGVPAHPSCLDTLVTFAHDTSVGFNVRKAAARALTLLGDPRGIALTTELSRRRGQNSRDLRPGTVELCLALIRSAAGTGRRDGDLAAYTECLKLLSAVAEDTTAHFYLRRYAAEILARLGDSRGSDVLAELMRTPSRKPTERCQAAGSLARADDARGADFLREMAADKTMRRTVRANAAIWLRWIHDPRAVEAFRAIYAVRRSRRNRPRPEERRDGTPEYRAELDLALGVRAQFEGASVMVDLDARRAARLALAQFGSPEQVAQLLGVAADPAARFDHRREAIRSLALQGAAAELAGLAEDPGCDGTVRCWAAEEASWLGENRGTEVLVSLVGSRAIDSYTRRRAAYFLVRLGDSRGTQLLAELATDPGTTIDARRTATQLLTQLDFVDTLVALVLDQRTGDVARLNAVDILAAHGRAEALARLRAEPALPHDVRHRAAQAGSRARDDT